MSKFYKIIVAYDGTNYHGWQEQPHNITVATQLKKSFFNAFKKDVSIVGASRTDAGVHALGQVARCKTDLDIDQQKIFNAWNYHLPNDIVIRSIEKVDPKTFHPLKNVTQKTYYYHVFLKRPLPFVSKYGWFWKFINKVDIEKFKKALQLFVGTHDFGSFVKIDKETSTELTTERTIDSIKVEKLNKLNALRITIKGKSFLHFQIRRMIGAALDVAKNKELSLDYIKNMLISPKAQQCYVKANGNGLCLRKIIYENHK
jgi:tRNA pseudouridine38-40 synthase